MKFAALISGGKDSTFNILECLNQGHELVALINLYPPTQCGKDELDSYMFQSVGHETINFISAAICDIPLYRLEISGTAVLTDLQYASDKDSLYNKKDEVEDLYEIIARVKKDFPDLKGISSGAILSNYQRTRVENVCTRLGLVSLAFMWERSQVELLETMMACQIDPVLIKIAALGLDGKKHLGQRIHSILGDLVSKSEKYGLNPCGEGGEYETVTLDAPYFQKKIEIVASRVVTLEEDEYAAVKYLKIDSMRLKDKDPESYQPCNQLYGSDLWRSLNLRQRLDPETIKEELWEELKTISEKVPHRGADNGVANTEGWTLKVLSSRVAVEANDEAAAVAAVRQAMEKMELMLEEVAGASKTDIVYCVLSVPNMANFAAINVVYSAFLAPVNYPARTCIETRERGIGLHCLVSRLPHDDHHQQDHQDNQDNKRSNIRSHMHIQSMSHWAPASIGPYSQAVSLAPLIDNSHHDNVLCLLSGQIGMNPEDSSMVVGDLTQECLVGLRHATRVAWSHCQMSWAQLDTMICYCTCHDDLHQARFVFHTAICSHSDVTGGRCLCSQVAWVTVRALPKCARVEWQAVFSTGRAVHHDVQFVLSTDAIDQMEDTSLDAVICIDTFLSGDLAMTTGSTQITF